MCTRVINQSGPRRPKDQQGEKEVAEADGVPVHDQVPQQPPRPASGPPLSRRSSRPPELRQVQAHYSGERLQVEGTSAPVEHACEVECRVAFGRPILLRYIFVFFDTNGFAL